MTSISEAKHYIGAKERYMYIRGKKKSISDLKYDMEGENGQQLMTDTASLISCIPAMWDEPCIHIIVVSRMLTQWRVLD